MGRHQNRDAIARHLLDEPPELAARERIDATCRLVEKHDSRLMENRAAQRKPLAPAAGQIAGPGPLAPRKPRHFDDELHARSDLVVGEAVQRAEEPDVLLDGQRFVQRKFLRHVADAPLDFFRIAAHVDAVYDRRSRRGLQQSAHHPDGRGLAGAVRAEKAEDLTTVHREADAIDRRKRAESARQIANDNRLAIHHCPNARSRRAPPALSWRARESNPVRPAGAQPARRARRYWSATPARTARRARGAPLWPRARLFAPPRSPPVRNSDPHSLSYLDLHLMPSKSRSRASAPRRDSRPPPRFPRARGPRRTTTIGIECRDHRTASRLPE